MGARGIASNDFSPSPPCPASTLFLGEGTPEFHSQHRIQILPCAANAPSPYGFSSLHSPRVEWGWWVGVKSKSGNFTGDYLKPGRGKESCQVIPSYLTLAGRENEPAARWKEQGLERKGGVFLCNQDEYVDLGSYSLWLLLLGAVTLRPGSPQQWK